MPNLSPENSTQLKNWGAVLVASGLPSLPGLSFGAYICRFAEHVTPGAQHYFDLTKEDWIRVYAKLEHAERGGGKKGVAAFVEQTLATEIAIARKTLAERDTRPTNPLTEADVKPILFSPALITLAADEEEKRGGFNIGNLEMPERIGLRLLEHLRGFHMFNGKPCDNLISLRAYVVQEYADDFLEVLAKKDVPKPRNFKPSLVGEGAGTPGGPKGYIYMFAPEDRDILYQLRVKKNGTLQELEYETGQDGRVRLRVNNLRIAVKLVTDYGFQFTNWL